MDQPAQVNLASVAGDPDGEAQEISNVHRLTEQPVERLAARIFEQQAPFDRASRLSASGRAAHAAQLVPQFIFVGEAIEADGCGKLCGEIDDQDRHPAALTAFAPSPGKNALAVLPQGLEELSSIGSR